MNLFRRLLTIVSALLLMLVLLLPAATAHKRWAHCATEGQVKGPCVWDAKHMGNGKGKSFKVFANGNLKYVTHRHAHRLAYRHSH